MVKKLMKHELIALFRTLVWLIGAVLLLGILARIAYSVTPSGEFDSMSVGVILSTAFVISMHSIAVGALLFAAVILSLVRFFKSLFTGEGYLTFSLPATPTQLLVAKFLSALIATVACYLAAFLSELIAVPLSEWWLLELLPDLFSAISAFFASEPLIAIEIILLLILLIPSGLLYLYLVASIGQLFTKGRVAITVVLYYGISFALSFFFMLFIVPIVEMALTSIHLLMWFLIVVVAAFDVGSFFFIRYILMHKVNLVV